jgi:hypothetical protein
MKQYGLLTKISRKVASQFSGVGSLHPQIAKGQGSHIDDGGIGQKHAVANSWSVLK